MDKREFLRLTALSSAAILTMPMTEIWAADSAFFSKNAPFEQKKLPYNFDALEPYIDKLTMEIHYGKHHAAYVNNLNKALETEVDLQKLPLEKLLSTINKETSTAIRNNGGGHFNHDFFWEILSPKTEQMPSGAIAKEIEKQFGSFEEFKAQFSKAAMSRFGSGWAWLCMNGDKKLFITSTPNQDNPLMTNLAEQPGIPLLGLDVWEHAYYLKYQNRRADYTEAFFKIINWELVSKKFEE